MMLGVFREHYTLLPGETEDYLRSRLLDEILARNGQPSLRQCERLAEIALQRGGPTLDPETLCAEFQGRLDAAIDRRVSRLSRGEARPDDFLVQGARPFLEHLARTGLTLVVLSSTIQERVEEEARLLGIDHFFHGKIFGRTGDPQKFSKRAVFERLLREERLDGPRLLSFGDGPIEIRDTVELGGIAIAVCSDEHQNGSGLCDLRKHAQLHAAGAHAALPDFSSAPELLDFLLGR